VFVQVPECAKAFYLPLQQAILEVGAYPIFEYLADGVTRNFYELATEDQITFLPRAFLYGKVAEMTHIISIIAETDKYELQGIDPNKISKRIASRKEYVEKRTQKELEGKMSWTIALFGTPAMAKEV
jgi:leucyl aminopeptidase (aminopeptidase T)